MADGTATGKKEVAKNVFVDDFCFDDEGNALVSQLQDTVAKIAPDGKVTVVSGSLNSTLVAGATTTEFGRTAVDRSVLYATTSGGTGDIHTVNTQVKLPCGCHSRILDRLGVHSRLKIQRKHQPAPQIINKN